MLNSCADPDLDTRIGLPAKERNRPTHVSKLLVAVSVMVLFGCGFATKAFALQGLIYESSGTCSFGQEPTPCEQYMSPCVMGAKYYYFPALGVLRTRDNHIVGVST